MRLLALLFACLMMLAGGAQAQVRPFDDIIASGVLKVAMYDNFPPYSYRDGDRARGVDVDLAQKLAEGQGLRLEILWINAGETLDDDLRNFIWKGHYLRREQLADLMLRVPYDRNYAMRRNELGELVNEQVVMFAPYQGEKWLVGYDSRRLPEVPSIAVFSQHKIGVELDSVPSFYMSSVMEGRLSKNTEHYVSPRAAFQAMQAAKVDAVMALRGEIEWLLHEAGDPQLKAAANAYPQMGRQAWDIGMAVHESNRQLAYAVEETLEELMYTGEMERIYASYGLTYEQPDMYR